jgi:uncharacterized protein YlxP (DUF503 family)
MTVGSCKIELAIAEVDRLDDWQRATLGVACVSNDARLVDATLSRVVNWIEMCGEALVVDYEIDLVTH